ncbi:predicted protein [Naegleria gruberi]|uniref:Predicted protein n=1 Tax=Naegleria gruberi TaxID=5762 RepID=D2VD39_NAEGR|nr:uncharacterized protein NAEGRDRAFT_48645 [Naegleria gruberi]EFC45262.1 predicted protein [Naegleria gruberi]|eukprot:XP_002678006.1 predicted protein [Naegleria gruberi strain NEG-M]
MSMNRSSSSSDQEQFIVFEEVPLSQIAPKFTTPFNQETTIGIVTINKPEKMNALCVKTAQQFRDLFTSDKIMKNKNLGCIVLTGAPSKTPGVKSAFSAGGDFDFLLERCNDQPYNNSGRMIQFYNSFLEPLLKFSPVPTISALNGHAVGAGLAISLATDVRFAETSAKLGVNFVNIGLSPALEIGMVYEVVEGEDKLREKALDYAARIARNPPIATKLCLKNLRMQQIQGLEQMITREADAQAQAYADPILKETITNLKKKSEKK